jgi:anti-anti-sigma regulatory factor
LIPMPAESSRCLTETVNSTAGSIRASGHLTRLGADLLSGTADSLRGNGHTRVVLDLREVRTADDAGLDLLQQLRTAFAAAGDELLIRHSPTLVLRGS